MILYGLDPIVGVPNAPKVRREHPELPAMNIVAVTPDEPFVEEVVTAPVEASPEVVEFLSTLDSTDLGALRGLIAMARAEGLTDTTDTRS